MLTHPSWTKRKFKRRRMVFTQQIVTTFFLMKSSGYTSTDSEKTSWLYTCGTNNRPAKTLQSSEKQIIQDILCHMMVQRLFSSTGCAATCWNLWDSDGLYVNSVVSSPYCFPTGKEQQHQNQNLCRSYKHHIKCILTKEYAHQIIHEVVHGLWQKLPTQNSSK